MSTTDFALDDTSVRDEAFYERFRQELHDFMSTQCPADLREKVRTNQKLGREEMSRWQKILFAHGWGAPNWIKAEGGTGWDLQQRYLFEEVSAQLDCPPLYHHGLGHIGPVIMHFGTEEQKARYLPPIVEGSEWWCQGYSEPGAGSDLASLKTAAVREGDEYVINGQKIWTSHAQEADLMYTLVRTSKEGRKQAGITLLVVPVNTPGIEVRPIHTIDQWHHVNEVFLNDVRVPVANRLGDEGEGWKCAKFLLDRERLSPATVPRLARQLEQVSELIQDRIRQEGATPHLYAALKRLYQAQGAALGAREMLLSAIQEEMNGTLAASKSSALKLHCSELSQDISSLAYDLTAGEYGARLLPKPLSADGSDNLEMGRQLVHTYLFYRSRSIAGGTSEVQKNVIARAIFGA
ncbi:acyl-CoA dehydrogenase family protein [Ottowia thiooxydans]|uniref:acyl-CoA dehydrogenase family protein n=1 Tax=Ottowia thiooxydans TaxID=219182 RepID=UPI0003FA7DAB|nr:acyl-CoA dehydrogenase family protein [Ottowia thiooxydans]